MVFAIRQTYATERLSDLNNNANILGKPNNTGDVVPANGELAAGKVTFKTVPNVNPVHVLAVFWAKQDIGNAATKDDVAYFRYKVPYTNYCRRSDGVIIGEFSNYALNVSADGWTESDPSGDLINFLNDGFPSNGLIRCDIIGVDNNVDSNLKQTDTFTTPASVTGGVVKVRVRKNGVDVLNSASGVTEIMLEFSSDNFTSIRLTCYITRRTVLDGAGIIRQDLGSANFTDAAAELTYTLNAVDANSLGSALLANTAYRVRIRARKTGGATNIDAVQRDIDFIRINFPSGESQIVWPDATADVHFDYMILDVRDPATPVVGTASFVELDYDLVNIHDPSITGAGLANTAYSSNNIWDEGWAADGSNNPTGWTTSEPAGATVDIVSGNLHLKALGNNIIASINKDVGVFPKYITFELHYRFDTLTAGANNRLAVFFYNGSFYVRIAILASKYQYNNNADTLTDITNSLSSVVGTDYILRGVVVFGTSAGTSSIYLWRRTEAGTTWDHSFAVVTTAGSSNATANGTVDIRVNSHAAANETAEATVKYFAVARGRIAPLDSVPVFADLARIRLSAYRDVGAATDANTVFTIDAMGVEEHRTLSPQAASLAPVQLNYVDSYASLRKASVAPLEDRVAFELALRKATVAPGVLRAVNLQTIFVTSLAPSETRSSSYHQTRGSSSSPLEGPQVQSYARLPISIVAPKDDTDDTRTSIMRVLTSSLQPTDLRVAQPTRAFQASILPDDTRLQSTFRPSLASSAPSDLRAASVTGAQQARSAPDDLRATNVRQIGNLKVAPLQGDPARSLTRALALSAAPRAGYAYDFDHIDADALVQALEDLKFYATMWGLREFGHHVQQAIDSYLRESGEL